MYINNNPMKDRTTPNQLCKSIFLFKKSKEKKVMKIKKPPLDMV